MIPAILMSNRMSRAKRSVRAWLLALLILSFAGSAGSVRAQEQSPKPQTPPADSSGKRAGAGDRLARETREAAGEDRAETAAVKQSWSLRMRARLTGMSL